MFSILNAIVCCLRGSPKDATITTVVAEPRSHDMRRARNESNGENVVQDQPKNQRKLNLKDTAPKEKSTFSKLYEKFKSFLQRFSWKLAKCVQDQKGVKENLAFVKVVEILTKHNASKSPANSRVLFAEAHKTSCDLQHVGKKQYTTVVSMNGTDPKFIINPNFDPTLMSEPHDTKKDLSDPGLFVFKDIYQKSPDYQAIGSPFSGHVSIPRPQQDYDHPDMTAEYSDIRKFHHADTSKYCPKEMLFCPLGENPLRTEEFYPHGNDDVDGGVEVQCYNVMCEGNIGPTLPEIEEDNGSVSSSSSHVQENLDEIRESLYHLQQVLAVRFNGEITEDNIVGDNMDILTEIEDIMMRLDAILPDDETEGDDFPELREAYAAWESDIREMKSLLLNLYYTLNSKQQQLNQK